MKRRHINLVLLSTLFVAFIIIRAFSQSFPAESCVAGGTGLTMATCTNGIPIPMGNTAQRASLSGTATIRYNTDTGSLEYSIDDTNWPVISVVTARSFNNAPTHPIQTVAAAANGFQLSTTRDALVSYSVLITVTASISSGQSGYVVLEISPTNSTSAASWVEVGRISASQIYTLAIALQGVQTSGTPVNAVVPAGYYARLRSVNVTGTPTYSFVSGQEVLQ